MTITCCELYHDALRQPRIAIRYSDGTEEDRAPTPSELHLLKRTPTEALPPIPTERMVAAARKLQPALYDMDIVNLYRAMLAVSPPVATLPTKP